MISYHCIAETLSLNSAGISDGRRIHVPQPLGIGLGRLSEVAFEFANEVRQASIADAVCGLAHVGPAQQEPTCLLHTQLFQELQRGDARRRLEQVSEARFAHADSLSQVPHGERLVYYLLPHDNRSSNTTTLILTSCTLPQPPAPFGTQQAVYDIPP